MQKIRLVLFSKYQIVRAALRHMLVAASDLEIVAEVENLNQAEQAVHKLHPDVVLVETIETTNPSIPKLAEKSTRNGKVSVVVLTNQGNPRLVRAMLRAGVAGYVLKHSSEAELLLAVRSAARGRKFLDASLIDQIAFEGAAAAGPAEGKHHLSRRESRATPVQKLLENCISAARPSRPTDRVFTRNSKCAAAPTWCAMRYRRDCCH